jgi:hypothetical protein
MFVLNPIFPYIPFLAFDFLDTAIILIWFLVAAPNYIPPWGPIWDLILARVGLFVVLLFWALHRRSASLMVSYHSNMPKTQPASLGYIGGTRSIWINSKSDENSVGERFLPT